MDDCGYNPYKWGYNPYKWGYNPIFFLITIQ